MTRIHQGKENKDFDKPEGIKAVSICTKSGKLPIGGICNTVRTDYFVEGTEPTEQCDHHVLCLVCPETGLLATAMCPVRVAASRILLPPMQEGVESAGTSDSGVGISPNHAASTCTLHTGGAYVPSEFDLGQPVVEYYGAPAWEEEAPPDDDDD